MKYHVIYCEGCSPRIKAFKSQLALTRFLNAFKRKYGSLDDRGDNWVGYIFYGNRIKLEQEIKLVDEI
jgi:hypothetical protein